MQKITPFLWFDGNAEEAANFYSSVFKDAKVGKILRYGDAVPQLKGQVLTVSLELFGQPFTLLNGGPQFSFTEAVSFAVHCENQEEVDYYWDQLTKEGEESMCGWLKDKYGLSWQIVPNQLINYISDPDEQKAARAMQAMMQMRKIDIATIEKAVQEKTAAVA
jgi:predicted 3-demethylubiquinone-9 3-methyltransferase (glyoxalase superfamily)